MAIYLGENLQSGALDPYDLAVAQGYTGTKSAFWTAFNNIGNWNTRMTTLEGKLTFLDNDDFLTAIFE